MGTIVAISLIVIAIMLFVAAKNKWIHGDTIELATRVASIMAFLAAVALFVVPTVPPPPPTPQAVNPQPTAFPTTLPPTIPAQPTETDMPPTLMPTLTATTVPATPTPTYTPPPTRTPIPTTVPLLFTGKWKGIDPQDDSVWTISLTQVGTRLNGTYSDSYSKNIDPPGWQGTGSGVTHSATTAKMTFNLTRWDGRSARHEFFLILSDQNKKLILSDCLWVSGDNSSREDVCVVMQRQ